MIIIYDYYYYYFYKEVKKTYRTEWMLNMCVLMYNVIRYH